MNADSFFSGRARLRAVQNTQTNSITWEEQKGFYKLLAKFSQFGTAIENHTVRHRLTGPAPHDRPDRALNGFVMGCLPRLNAHHLVAGTAYILRQHEIRDAGRDFGAET